MSARLVIAVLPFLFFVAFGGEGAAASVPGAAASVPGAAQEGGRDRRPEQAEPTRRLAELSASLEAIAAAVGPSVVQVSTTGFGFASDPAGSALLTPTRGEGSGVIVDSAGWIVTNAHVVAGAERVQVRLALLPADRPAASILRPRGEELEARVVGTDAETDLAVIKVERGGLPAAVLGDSDDLRAGQLVLAVGSPLGLENTVTLGVVSAVARQLRPEDPMVYVQTDAAIGRGNSGGPLVDARGRVVGINTAVLTDVEGGGQGIGLAAPSNIVGAVYGQIRRFGRVRRGVVGVTAQTIDGSLAEGLGLPRDWGVVVADVQPGGPAARAGLRVGDVVVALDGKTMENARQFDVNVYRKTIGDVTRLDVLRGDSAVVLEIPVYERPYDPRGLAEHVSAEENLVPELGIFAAGLSAELRGRLPPLRSAAGVLVAARAGGSVQWIGDLQPGDVIVALNRVPVSGLATLRSALGSLSPESPLVAHVERRGGYRFVTLRRP